MNCHLSCHASIVLVTLMFGQPASAADAGRIFVYATPYSDKAYIPPENVKDVSVAWSEKFVACAQKEDPCLCKLELAETSQYNGPVFVEAGIGENAKTFFFAGRLAQQGSAARYVWTGACPAATISAFETELALVNKPRDLEWWPSFKFGRAMKF